MSRQPISKCSYHLEVPTSPLFVLKRCTNATSNRLDDVLVLFSNPVMATGRQFDLPYLVEPWDDTDSHVEELIALICDYSVARAAFDEAVKRRPGRIVTLRQKTRLIADSRNLWGENMDEDKGAADIGTSTDTGTSTAGSTLGGAVAGALAGTAVGHYL